MTDSIPDAWAPVLAPLLDTPQSRQLGGWLRAEEDGGKVIFPPRGSRLRLGTVTSMTTEAFVLPRNYLGAGGEVTLLAQPIGTTDSFRSAPVQVFAGQEVAFTIQNHLSISSVVIRSE